MMTIMTTMMMTMVMTMVMKMTTMITLMMTMTTTMMMMATTMATMTTTTTMTTMMMMMTMMMTMMMIMKSCEHPWEIELDHPKTHCLKSLPHNTYELCDCRSNQFRKGEEKKKSNTTRVLTYQRLICFP